MATFTLSTAPGVADVGSTEDDIFIVPSYDAWIATGRTIRGLNGFDTIRFDWQTGNTVQDAEFAGLSDLEALEWGPQGAAERFLSLGSLAALAFAGGLDIRGDVNIAANFLTVPIRFEQGPAPSPSSIQSGAGDDVLVISTTFPIISAGAGNDRIILQPTVTSPFENNSSGIPIAVFGGDGYDILVGLGAGAVVTAASGSAVSGIEEIWTNAQFNLLSTSPGALTGTNGPNGPAGPGATIRNPLVLRPDGGVLNIHASDDGRPSYDGRIVAYGAAGADTVRGSSTHDYLDGGTGGADSLSGEAGNDWLVFHNASHGTNAARIAGGDGYDILALNDANQIVEDTAFAQATSIEELRLLGTGTQRVTFGANSDTAFAASSFGAGSVSATLASSLVVDAAGSSRALSIYGTNGADTLTGGAGNDYIEAGTGWGLGGLIPPPIPGSRRTADDTIDASAGDDHIFYDFRLDLALSDPVASSIAPSIDGGTGHDVVLVDTTGAALIRSFDLPAARWRGIEELRLVGTGALELNLSQGMFTGSATGTATIQAPNAASVAINLGGGFTTMGASVYGTAGADVFYAGFGRDYLHGGSGADRFSFIRGCNEDVIADFVSGLDKISLNSFAGIMSFADVQASSTIVGGNLHIRLNANDGIILAGVTSITSSDVVLNDLLGGGSGSGSVSVSTVFLRPNSSQDILFALPNFSPDPLIG